MVDGTKESDIFSLSFFLRYTTNQAMGKVPKPISKSARRDVSATAGKLGNVRSGKQVMLTQRSRAVCMKSDIILKPDSPKSQAAKRLISPALGSHARLVSLRLNS